jgi:Sulfotransferase family
VTRLPDFYIAGAPKCGTSALYAYLNTHPGTAMSRRKEPSYWATDIMKREACLSLEAYLEQWDGAPPQALRGEASPNYLRSAVAIPRIREATPEARFILILRNPIDMASAWHSQLIRTFDEDVADFEKAWRLQATRLEGRRIPPECIEPEYLQYKRVCALGDQLERFVSLVPEERRLILLLEEFEGDSRAAYRRALDFLGLADDGRADFPIVNRNRNRRVLSLAGPYRRGLRRLGRLHPPLRAAAAALGLHPSALVGWWDYKEAPRRPLRAAFRAELQHAFEPQILKMEAILGRDFAVWREAAEPAGRAR